MSRGGYSDEPGRGRRDDDRDRGRDDDYARGRGRDDDYDRGRGPVRDVPNYLVQSILVTLFCCLIGGIVSIIYAAQVNGKLAAGDVRGAIEASNNAKTWCWVSFGIGLVGNLIGGIIYATALSSLR
jgi:hypothetical protein